MPERAPIHLHPTAPVAELALLPGDPGRALALAQALLEDPKMFNHNRGLWGYTGTAADGARVTIQATGMGGPSAAIVLTELIALGVRSAVRVGTCGALAPGLALGDVIVAESAIAADGTSRALGADGSVAGDSALTSALAESDPRAAVGTVVSVDLFYDDGHPAQDTGALAVEMEAATLFALGRRLQVPVGCVLAVSDTFDADGGRTRIEQQTLATAAERTGRTALAALQAAG
jgi:DeoD family purine-nucleoside phosphorylase